MAERALVVQEPPLLSSSPSKENETLNTPVTFNDLDQMAAEVLPERTVLSVIVTPPGGGGAIDSGGGTTMMSTCTTTTTYHEPGVIGVLGLGINNVPVTTTTCTPSAVVSN